MVRKSKGVLLTPEGTAFLRQAEKLIEHFAMVESGVPSIRKMFQRLRFGVGASNAASVLAPLYKRYQSSHPSGGLSILEGAGHSLKTYLDDALVDFIIIPREHLTDAWGKQHMVVALEDIPVFYCVHERHPLAGCAAVHFDNIVCYPLAVWSGHSGMRKEIEDYAAGIGEPANILCMPSQLSTVVTLVRNGIAAAFLPRALFETEPNIIGIDCKDLLPVHPVAVWSKVDLMGEKREFAEFLLQNYQKI